MTGAQGASAGGRVIVIVLVYRGADIAIECLSSVLASDHPDFRIIVLDNASPDGAYPRLKAWAGGDAPPTVANSPIGATANPSGPLDFAERESRDAPRDSGSLPRLTLVQTGANLGYAGGNNVALRWLQNSSDWDYAWILNPDTVVARDAMSALVRKCASNPRLGVVGARIACYDQPDVIQEWGGAKYRPWRGTGRLLGLGHPASEAVDEARIAEELSYVSGASLFFTREFLGRAGAMDESYFLYFEEADWCRRRGDLKLGYAHDARVYHRLGSSIGSSTSYRDKSRLSIAWSLRNRFRFARKFHPSALPLIYLSSYIDIAHMVVAGAFANAWLEFKLINGLARYPVPPAAMPGLGASTG
ncbi:MAG TPA: glycosyltransferase family 2 protein [Alphaproteobacteria bacterium]|nr:glycosyltransferase family 2 protein [Alphaproteobacteria bacterium]